MAGVEETEGLASGLGAAFEVLEPAGVSPGVTKPERRDWEGATTSSSLDSVVVSSTKVSLLEEAGPGLWADGAAWDPLASSSLPEELLLLSSEAAGALAVGCPEGVAVAC